MFTRGGVSKRRLRLGGGSTSVPATEAVAKTNDPTKNVQKHVSERITQNVRCPQFGPSRSLKAKVVHKMTTARQTRCSFGNACSSGQVNAGPVAGTPATREMHNAIKTIDSATLARWVLSITSRR